MKSLYLATTEPEGYVSVDLSDERDRAKAGEVDKCAVASVTFDKDGPDATSWGEFLTLADVQALHAWTGALIAEHYKS